MVREREKWRDGERVGREIDREIEKVYKEGREQMMVIEPLLVSRYIK